MPTIIISSKGNTEKCVRIILSGQRRFIKMKTCISNEDLLLRCSPQLLLLLGGNNTQNSGRRQNYNRVKELLDYFREYIYDSVHGADFWPFEKNDRLTRYAV